MKNNRTNITLSDSLIANNLKEQSFIENIQIGDKISKANTKLRKIEKKLIRGNHLYSFINQINRTTANVQDENHLYNEACNIATEYGNFKMAWLGIPEEKKQRIKLISSSGVPKSAIRTYGYKTYDKAGPAEFVLKNNNFHVVNDLSKNTEISWSNYAYSKGLNSSIALAIKRKKKTVACFFIYSDEVNFFSKDEIDMLLEVAHNISYCLDKIEKDKKQILADSIEVKNENRFRVLSQNSVDMVTHSNQKGDILYGSPSISNFFGYTNKELMHNQFSEVIHPDDMKEFADKKRKFLNTAGASFIDEHRLLHKNGKWIWCEAILTNHLEEIGIHAIVTNFRDISVRKENELKVKFESNTFTPLKNSSDDLMWSVDKDFKLITSNLPFVKSLKKLFGLDIKNGDNVLPIKFPKYVNELYRKWYKRAFNGEFFTEIFYTPAPNEMCIEILFLPIKDGDQIVGTACHSRDITKLKLDESMLAVSNENIVKRKKAEFDLHKIALDLMQRNRDLEQFTFIVSHSIRAPLANILGITNILDSEKLGAKELKKFTNGLSISANSLNNVLIDLNTILQVKRDLNDNKEVINFEELIGEISQTISHLIEKHHVTIIHNFSKAEEIFSLRLLFYSIFYNLIINSIKFAQPKLNPIIEISSSKVDGKTILTFKDNGLGIDLKLNSKKVFGPYNRFHRHVEGKGMGLFMTKSQVVALGGTINIKSEPLKGTLITIEI